MKKHFLILAVAAAFTVSACNDKTSDTATTEQQERHMHDDMDDHDHGAMHEDGATTMQNVPDYSAAPQAVKTQLKQVLNDYLKLNDALVKSDGAAAKNAAAALEASAKKVEAAQLQGEQQSFANENIEQVTEHAANMAGTNDVEAQRKHLQPLSQAMYSLTKAFGAADRTLYYQHCPMANNDEGGDWLSSNKEIRNPYFGDRMLKCGSTKETLQR